MSAVDTLRSVPDVTLYDTRTRSLQPFEPRDPSRVGIYACGPTVYARVHVGNARPFVVFSQLKRFLEHEGYGVMLVGNVTDINDKIYDAARAAGRPSAELADEMAAHYIADTDRLGLGRPDAEPLRDRVRRADHRADPAADRRRLGLRGLRATCTSACARSTPTASCRGATSTRWTRARASRARI